MNDYESKKEGLISDITTFSVRENIYVLWTHTYFFLLALFTKLHIIRYNILW
jgi:hypothetical protein